jgi:hypothetical protein
MPHCSVAGLDFKIISAGFNAPLKFLTGYTRLRKYKIFLSAFSGEKTDLGGGATDKMLLIIQAN